MPIAIEMPKMTDTMEEGVLVEWSVEEGDKIAAGDVIAQVETDKATMDVEAYDDGVLLKKVAQAGDALPIGGLIAVLGEAGEDVSAILASHTAEDNEPPAPAETPTETPTPAPANVVASEVTVSGRVKASPLAKRMAADHGLQLTHLTGSGPGGRIIKRDVEAQMSRPRIPAPVGADRGFETVRISQMRKAIARRLAESKYTSPHFYLNVDVDVTALIAHRTATNDFLEKSGRPKVSFNDFVTKASAIALVQHPDVNVTYAAEEGVIRRYNYVDVGVAVAIEDGLVTPVVRNAHQKSVAAIAEETQELAARARDRKLTPEEMEGSTFTTSNLGMFGIESFTAIINPPNACILAIGTIRDVPVVQGGVVVPGKRMKLTLSCDHRAVDGAVGARFFATLKELLENPISLFLQEALAT
ncbi:MAG: 2-oxo acid dehydrogenase subunit E2 [Rhodothermaceae bacterium]|nr:2-oxo acid dehydrogenase subunit E2 [Rhodothermaceae bacterium]MYF39456.1 2-oxo acid dehydrogenase subunit E2 [Rhodothermaceae bacterium]